MQFFLFICLETKLSILQFISFRCSKLLTIIYYKLQTAYFGIQKLNKK